MKSRVKRLRSTAARICHHSAAARSLRNRLDQLFAYELAGQKHLPLVLDSRFRAGSGFRMWGDGQCSRVNLC